MKGYTIIPGAHSSRVINIKSAHETKRKNYTSNRTAEKATRKLLYIFVDRETVAVAQLVRASDCGSEGRGFETHQPPKNPD